MSSNNKQKKTNVSKCIDLDEKDQLKIQNILYKVQLEQERINKYTILIENSNLIKQMAEQELKMWESDLKNELSKDHDMESMKMQIDADNGKIIINRTDKGAEEA